jgi:hypothetical protein
LYEEGANGETEVTGLRLTRAGVEHIAKADVYVAALDVPGGLVSVTSNTWRQILEFSEECIGKTEVWPGDF